MTKRSYRIGTFCKNWATLCWKHLVTLAPLYGRLERDDGDVVVQAVEQGVQLEPDRVQGLAVLPGRGLGRKKAYFHVCFHVFGRPRYLGHS